tara:strand:- start:2887 stop:3063 length:177 start_codon:yes stop_codon:yes gene_type:complete
MQKKTKGYAHGGNAQAKQQRYTHGGKVTAGSSRLKPANQKTSKMQGAGASKQGNTFRE